MLFYNTEQERDSPFLFVVFGFPLPLRLCLLFLSQVLPDGVCYLPSFYPPQTRFRHDFQTRPDTMPP